MDNVILSAENLSVGYKEPLIKDICFNVRGGEIMTLIGPNGAGKSTILKTLFGYLKKLGGTVFIENRNIEELSANEKAKKLSVVLTERISGSMMTCRDVVETGRYPYTGYFGALSGKDKEAVESAMKMVEMTDFADSDFYEVSDGQRQRVMLARAICQEPKVMILDEPTSYLDIHHKISFLEILRRLADSKGTAVIVSMHELDFAEKISDFTMCVKNGRVTHYGKPEEIFREDIIQELFDVPESLYEKYFK